MGVEIGTLVLRGQFGTAPQEHRDDPRARAMELEQFRRSLLREIEEMMTEADRPAWDR